jgi:uncharacterized protein with HEPN domain
MSQHSDLIRLRHMLDHAREARDLARTRSREDLDLDRLLNLSLVRLLEIVGEAAARVSPEAQGRLQGVPWADIVGLRNRVIHGYDRVDFDVLWDTVRFDLPPLIAALESFLAAESEPID